MLSKVAAVVAEHSKLVNAVLFPAPSRSSYSPSQVFTSAVDGRSCRIVQVRLAQVDGSERSMPLLVVPRPTGAKGEGKPWVLYLHGNASDLGDNVQVLDDLACAMQCDVVGVEYPGYGIGTARRPSAAGALSNAFAAYVYCVALGYPAAQCTVYGYSIGGAVAAALVANLLHLNTHRVLTLLSTSLPAPRALVLHSTFSSLRAMAMKTYGAMGRLAIERFPTDRLAAALPPSVSLVVVHGTDDRLIPFSHAQTLANACAHSTLISIADGGHDVPAAERFLPQVAAACNR